MNAEVQQTKQFIAGTKAPKWKAVLEKRLVQLQKQSGHTGDVEFSKKITAALDRVHELIKDRPEYNRKRKPRTKKA